MPDKKEIRQFIWILWLAIFMALGGVTLIAYNLNLTVRNEAARQYHNTLRFIAESSAKSVKLSLERVISELVFQTQLEVVKNFETPKVHESFGSVILNHQGLISHMLLFSGTGEGVAAVVEKGPSPTEVKEQAKEYLRETLAGYTVRFNPRLVAGEAYRGVMIGMPITRKARPPEGAGSAAPSVIFTNGLVAAIVNADTLVDTLIAPIPIEENGVAWLVTGSGDVVGDAPGLARFSRALYGPKGDAARVAQELAGALKGDFAPGWSPIGPRARDFTLTARGETWLVSAARINALDQVWTLALATPRDAATGLVTRSFWQSVGLVAFAALIFLSGGVMLTRAHRRMARAEEKALLAAALEEKNRTLAELNRRMDEFVAVVSHDIRSPLNVIRGYIKLIQSAPGGNAFERETANMMRSCNRLAQLTSDILDIAKLESGKMTLAYDPVNLDSLIMESVQTMEFATTEKQLRVRVELGEETVIEGDSGKLLQVMNNLIGNAVKFTPKGGAITITKAARGGVVDVGVADTGPGIDVKDQDILFSRFEQVRRHQLGVEPGSGLGLSICKSIVELHGGSIRVTSTPGQGSVFTVTLPMARPAR